MFADPQSVTYNAVAESVKRINNDAYKSEYLNRDSAHELRLTIGHSYEGAVVVNGIASRFERHLVRLDRATISAGVKSPLVSAYVVLRMKEGADPAELVLVGKSLRDYLTNAVITDVVALQS